MTATTSSALAQAAIAAIAPVAIAHAMRGGQVESFHYGTIVVSDVSGNVVALAGDPETFCYFRSSAKPFQAVPLIESGAADAFGFTERELALCCASHMAEPHHQAEVAAMLRKIGLDEDALRCGISRPSDRGEAARVTMDPSARSPLQCDCSGKHTGMLATCLHLDEPLDTYLMPEHPAQRRILAVMANALRMPEQEIVLGTDGCSLPTFGGPVRAFATSFATLASPEHAPSGAGREHAVALDRLRAAMIAAPENVAGTGDLVTNLMELGEGRIVAKSGAEGLLCIGLPEHGLGIAIRIADGSYRAHGVVADAVLRQLSLVPGDILDAVRERDDPTIRSHNGWVVGELRAAVTLSL